MNLNYCVDSSEFTEVEYLIQGVTLALLTIFAFTYGGFHFNLDDFTFILIGGFFAGFREMWMGIALMNGKAGVVISLINSQCIFLIVINYFAFNEISSTLEIIAAVIEFAGVVVISLGSEIYSLFRWL